MSRQIIKQPNGLYCIFSSIVDNIIYYNMTPEEIIEELVEEKEEEIAKNVKEIVSKLEKGEKPYYQSTISYIEMIDRINVIHGEEEIRNVKILQLE